MNNSRNRICEICKIDFIVKYPSYKTKTCSKECKNKLASSITKKQFLDENNREIARQNAIIQHNNKDLKQRLLDGVKLRDEKWKEKDYHPRKGKTFTEESKEKISSSNKGKNKGKTWEEILGKEQAEIRRTQNSEYMAKTNEILLKERRSNLEEQVLNKLEEFGFKNNIRVGKYTADFFNDTNNKIIEIHGDYWHCNPSLYNSDFFNKSINMTSKEKWEYDINRNKYLENKGYEVYVIWEKQLQGFIEKITSCNSIEDILDEYTNKKAYSFLNPSKPIFNTPTVNDSFIS
jgi:very-short-patch-repair endonuclease